MTLQLRWSADSSWDGEYYGKPYRFLVHEELEGRLDFVVGDSARVIELRDDGSATGATFVGAVGSSAYTVDERAEAGDCAQPPPDAPPPTVEPPYVARVEGRASWDSAAPGRALIVMRSGTPIGVAFSPRPIPAHSVRRLICPSPETVTRQVAHRIVARAGDAVDRRRDTTSDTSGVGHWVVGAANSASGEVRTTTTARYTYTAQQRRPGRDDPSGAVGRLEVKKTLTFTWAASH
jgi:hypothetical protein